MIDEQLIDFILGARDRIDKFEPRVENVVFECGRDAYMKLRRIKCSNGMYLWSLFDGLGQSIRYGWAADIPVKLIDEEGYQLRYYYENGGSYLVKYKKELYLPPNSEAEFGKRTSQTRIFYGNKIAEFIRINTIGYQDNVEITLIIDRISLSAARVGKRVDGSYIWEHGLATGKISTISGFPYKITAILTVRHVEIVFKYYNGTFKNILMEQVDDIDILFDNNAELTRYRGYDLNNPWKKIAQAK